MPTVLLTPRFRLSKQSLSLSGVHPGLPAGDLRGGRNISELFGHAVSQLAPATDRVVVSVDGVVIARSPLRPQFRWGFSSILGFGVFRFFARWA